MRVEASDVVLATKRVVGSVHGATANDAESARLLATGVALGREVH
jgi:hypothetical protein